MAWIDWLVAVAVFLPLLAYSIFAINQQLSTKIGTQAYEVKTNALNYWHQLFETLGQPSNWNKDNWEKIGLAAPLYRIPIRLTETAGISRISEPVDLHLVLDANCEGKATSNTIRIFYQDEEVPFSLYNITYCSPEQIKEANLVFLANVSANQTKIYYLYFSNETEVKEASYASDLNYGTYLENSKVKLNITGEISDLYYGSNNLLAGRSLGLMQYNATTGTIEESNATSGNPSLAVDSSLKKVIEIAGSTDWYDYSIRVTLYAYQPWFKLDMYAKEKIDLHVDDFRMPEAELYSAFSQINWQNSTGSYTSSDANGLVNASWIAPFNSTGITSLALLKANDSSAEWESYGEKIAFTQAAGDYTAGQSWVETVYVMPFTDINEVNTFWLKIKNPLHAEILPTEELRAISISKLKQLKEINYTEVKESLGGYDFRIEIS